MILKGSQRAGARELAAHLMNTLDNEHVEVHEVRGFAGTTLPEALQEIDAISKGTRCKQYMFSLSLNPPPDENVPIEAFEKAIDKIERRLGLEGQPRVVVFHEKQGRRHAHCVWSRIDAENMKAINLPHYKFKLCDLSRELYLEHGWELPKGHTQQKDPMNYTLDQWQQAMRHEDDPKAIKMLMQKCWRMTNSGKALSTELEKHGYFLARGDQRGVVAVDWRGEVYSLSRWTGVSSKELKDRVGDLQALPSVADIKARIAEPVEKNPPFVQETEKGKQDITAKVVNERKETIARHRQERKELHTVQAKRDVEETRHRNARMPHGQNFARARVMGEYQSIRKRNEQETVKCTARDRAEKHTLIQRQLGQRRQQQRQMKVWLGQHQQRTATFKRDIAAYVGTGVQKDVQAREAATSRNPAGQSVSAPMLGISHDIASSRAAAAYEAESSRWQAYIEEVARDPFLSKEEKAAIINGLHERQKIAAEAIRKQVMELDDETKSIIQERERIINTFGNLTLVTGSLNPSLGNAAWKTKKQRLEKSLLALNRDISEKESWNEELVIDRAEALAGIINKIWPESFINIAL